jgi:signal transduction histidine kinase
MSARARLTISFTALFGAIVLALAIAAYILARNDAYLRLDAALQVATGATAMSAAHELGEHATKLGGERDLQLVLEEGGSSALADTQILVREGPRSAAYKSGTPYSFDLRNIPPEKLANGVTFHGYRIATRNLLAPKFNTAYRVYAAKPIASSLAPLARIRVGLFVLVPIGLSLAGIAGYLLAKKSLHPLKQLAQTVDEVTYSDLSARVKPSNRDDEIGTLGRRFNSLLDRLERAFTLQRRFMADASHQIRTPVTVALTAAQVTSRDPTANLRDCKDALHIIEHQMLQLRKAVEDMFFLSQADVASLKIERKEVYLDDAVSDAIRAAKTLSRQKEQILTVSELPEAACLGDVDLLKQAVMILLDNSVKFTPPGGDIEVAVSRREKSWVCSVTDTGTGISEAAQARVFERFFRERRPGKEAAAGAGLGLAIAKSIVESHDGTLTLVESRPGRTRFEIAIPMLEKETNRDAVYANSFPVRM